MFYETIRSKIIENQAHIVIMGLGYVGLPLAAELAKTGSKVTGFDPDVEKVRRVNEGSSYVDYPSSEVLTYLTKELSFSATSDASVLSEADIVVICVPTPLSKTKEPDLSMVSSAVALIAQHQHPGMLVVLESTSYPGTTREFLVPQLTRGYKLGHDVFVGYSPERIDPGNKKYNLTNTPKIVAGVTPNCAKLTQRLYYSVNEVIVPVTSPEVAEMAKVYENTFRAVNIGLANEVALIARKLGIDPFEVIDAAATKPFGFMPFYPGPGLGGHCIPIDPLYLSWKLRSVQGQARFIELADTINSGMPDHVVSVVTEALNERSKSVRGSKILILGVAYKADVSDVRESPVIPLMQKLVKLGADVNYEDPLVPHFEDHELKGESIVPNSYGDYDLVIVAAPHKEFDLERILTEARCVVDTRCVYRDKFNKPLRNPKIHRI